MWTALAITAVVALAAMLFYVAHKAENRRLARATTAFLADRQPVSDAEFVAGCHGAAADFALAARLHPAEQSGVPAELTGPTDTLAALADLWSVGESLLDLVFVLERHSGGKLSRGDPTVKTTEGEYIGFLASQVPPAVS
jgi:hypothetical protein